MILILPFCFCYTYHSKVSAESEDIDVILNVRLLIIMYSAVYKVGFICIACIHTHALYIGYVVLHRDYC